MPLVYSISELDSLRNNVLELLAFWKKDINNNLAYLGEIDCLIELKLLEELNGNSTA